jgi:hypothetical protein
VNDRTRSILEAAGVEHAARRPVASGEVIPLQLVSRHLTRPPSPPEAIPEPPVAEPAAQPAIPAIPEGVTVFPAYVGWMVRVGKYLGFLMVAITLLMAFSWTRQTLILADVGRSTCSTLRIADNPEAQTFWTEEDASSTVPKLRTAQFVACMRAGSPF